MDEHHILTDVFEAAVAKLKAQKQEWDLTRKMVPTRWASTDDPTWKA